MSRSIGKCTWRYALVDGVKTDIFDAGKGCSGICPICGEVLVPRMGELREWHWWHKGGRKCDAWYEPKGEWHRWWQDHFEKERQEVPLFKEINGETCKHIADVHTSDKWTIEFQYSSLSIADIEEREQFYGNMFWVVSGSRLQADSLNGMRWKRHKVEKSKHGIDYFLLDPSDINDPSKIEDVNRCWRNRNKLVFFDFDGTFDKPSEGTDLFCLLPGEVYRSRLVVRLSQSDFLSKTVGGNARALVDAILDCRNDYCEKLKKERDEHRKAEALRLKEERESFLKKCEKKYQFDLANPTMYAVTCNWVEGLMVKYSAVKSLVRNWDLSGIPPKGRMALHLTNDYTLREYWYDIKTKVSKLKLGRRVPDYEVLKKCKGMVIGKIDYETYYDNQNREWELMIEDFEPLLNYEGEGRCIYKVRDRNGEGVWPLSDQLAQAVNDRKYWDSRKMKCPYCGEDMKQCRRNVDNGLFFGCSAFPKCKCALPCNKAGQINVSDLYRLHEYP